MHKTSCEQNGTFYKRLSDVFVDKLLKHQSRISLMVQWLDAFTTSNIYKVHSSNYTEMKS